ncbi:hypothetical protein KBK19_15540 [Microvirga sp. STR05]|uniref:Uncharacterized protein n=1 Tax=Hymenobacter duratus TaxID=2771356 RepID=A0ABR8JPI4_9BACT|nr:hypothetical protein [Hymenobacter duratus]MBD2716454.1 hypothetical protein [Hymenobacter duratus]MBR7951369.1 hypothetical protein [Microvirga sp. STR05]
MITFDKLKILLPLSIVEVNTASTEWKQSGSLDTVTNLRVGSLKERKTRHRPHVLTHSVRPGLNYIAIDYIQQECTIVVTGKIINGTALLSRETILQALQSINASNLLRLNPATALREAHLLSADITTDNVMRHPVKEYTRTLSSYYVGSNYIKCRDYTPNLQLQHKSKTAKFQRSLTLYDKHSEAPTEGYHPNTLRTELRLTSFEMLRKYLKLLPGPIMLADALNSTANALQTVFKEIEKDILLPTLSTMTDTPTLPLTAREALFCSELDFDRKATFHHLKAVDFNLAPLQAELKGNKNAARILKPYKDILTRWQSFNSDSSHDAKLLRELMGKIKTPTIHNLVSKTITDYAEAIAA